MKSKLFFFLLLSLGLGTPAFCQTWTFNPLTNTQYTKPSTFNASATISPGNQTYNTPAGFTVTNCTTCGVITNTCVNNGLNGSNFQITCSISINIPSTATGNIGLSVTTTNGTTPRTGSATYLQPPPLLPVELVSFKSNSKTNKVELNWNTASELNNEKFLIERSIDGKTYKAIGEKAGHGTTTEPQSYHFMDEHPVAGINYYRLKQMDFDGNFEYSPVESVVMRKDGEIAIYPTVTQGELQIALPEAASETTTINIFSMNGALVSKQNQEGTGVITLTLPTEMISGQYIVEVINGNLSKRTQIFKQ